MTNKIDFLAIGDIVTEPFIKIKDAQVHCKINTEECELCVRFGDKIPYESAEVIRAVGNSANAAVAAARLGVNSYLMSYIGDDEIGRGNLEELRENNVQTDYVTTAPGFPSNYHFVLWYGVERTILVKHTEFPYSFPTNLAEPKWIYLSSLAPNSADYHDEIAEYLKTHPEVKLAFQPGTFQMKLGAERLKNIYGRADVFFCNADEARRILGTGEKDFIKLMKGLARPAGGRGKLGPKIVVLTDGIKGAYARDGNSPAGEAWFMPVYPHEPYERTGAGDAFASTFTAALLLGKSIEEALMWAPINAMSVVQKVGAQKGLLSRAELKKYLAKAPADYKPRKIN